MNKYIIFFYLIAFTTCKFDSNDAQKLTTSHEVEGRYVDKIQHNTISFTDGKTIELKNPKKVFYLIRHAEKDTIPKSNPILTEAGYQRAIRVAEIFEGTKLDNIYSTFYNRTLHTVDSLSTLKSMPIKIYQPNKIGPIADSLNQLKTPTRLLFVGHSNTTPGFTSALMQEKMFDQNFDESDYDNLMVVVENEKTQKVLYKLKFK